MFRLFTRSPQQSGGRAPRRASLSIEALESRYALDGSASLEAPPDGSALTCPILLGQPPVISNFAASQGVGGQWTFSGKVADPDESVVGFVVRFGGLPSLQGQTAIVGADGTFSLTIRMGPQDDGVATAQTNDSGGLVSNLAQTNVHQP